MYLISPDFSIFPSYAVKPLCSSICRGTLPSSKSAIVREESRGGHTRDDFPAMDPKWRSQNNIAAFNGKEVVVKQQKLPKMPNELFDLFDIHELEKYLSKDELPNNAGVRS